MARNRKYGKVWLGGKKFPGPIVKDVEDPTPPPPPPPTSSSIKYRRDNWVAFNAAQYKSVPPRVAGGADLNVAQTDGNPNKNAPDARMVDRRSGWAWNQQGGDTLSAPDGAVRNGPDANTYWATRTIPAGGVNPTEYSWDITNLMQWCMTNDHWMTMKIKSLNVAVTVGGKFGPNPPRLHVVYTDAFEEDLHLVVTSQASVTTGSLIHLVDTIRLPIFFEFIRPKHGRTVQSATLFYTVTTHPSSNSNVVIQLLDPNKGVDVVVQGIAQNYILDEGIEAHPSVIGAHIYKDDLPESTWIATEVDGQVPSGDIRTNWSPDIWDEPPGAQDLTKLPYRDVGKWVSTGMDEDYGEPAPEAEGPFNPYRPTNRRWFFRRSNDLAPFSPIAPGLGGCYVRLPRYISQDGAQPAPGFQRTAGGGTNSFIPLPAEHSGLLDEIYVRCYFVYGFPDGRAYKYTTDDLYNYQYTDGTFDWTAAEGKFFLPWPGHNPWRGFSGGSGGGNGYQMRPRWQEHVVYDPDNGPASGGLNLGFHLYDYQQNPPEHNYSNWDSIGLGSFGQQGGYGGNIYAYQWYCIEIHWKLNTADFNLGTYQADGMLEAWIDGRLVYTKSGMVFRVPPKNRYVGSNVTPSYREMGFNVLLMNWYNGGHSGTHTQRVGVISNLVWGTQYIGPMRFS